MTQQDNGGADVVRDIYGETLYGMKVAAYMEDVETPTGTHQVVSFHWSTPGKSAVNVKRLFTESDVRALLAARSVK